MCFVRVLLVHLYDSTDTATVWKKSRFNSIWEIKFPEDRQAVNAIPFLPYAYADIIFCRWDIAVEVFELIS